MPAHKLPHDGQRHLAVAVDDVEPPNVHDRETHRLQKKKKNIHTRHMISETVVSVSYHYGDIYIYIYRER